MAARRKDRADWAWRPIKAIPLGGALVFSALLMAVAVGSSSASWVAWISLLPLFWAIRVLCPLRAALSGALWGLSLYFFCVAGAAPAISPTLSSIALLTTIPAIYAGLGSLLTRGGGFNPILLGLGWVLVDLALKPLGVTPGVLATTGSEGTCLDWTARVFGYVLVAFLVAFANASLLAVFSKARLSIPQLPYRIASRDSGASVSPQTFFCVPLFAIRSSRPRGPPIPCLPR